MKKQKKPKPKSKRAVIAQPGAAQPRAATASARGSARASAKGLRAKSAASHLTRNQKTFSSMRLPNAYWTARRSLSAVTSTYSSDDRQALALLMLPFLIVAFAIGSTQSLHFRPANDGIAAAPAPFARPSEPMPATGGATLTANDNGVKTLVGQPPLQSARPIDAPRTVTAEPPRHPIVVPTAAPTPPLAAAKTDAETLHSKPDTALAAAALQATAELAATRPQSLAATRDVVPTLERSSEPIELAALPADVGLSLPGSLTSPGQPATSSSAPDNASSNVCVAEAASLALDKPDRLAALGGVAGSTAGVDPIAFGMALAAAAREQLDDFTVYTDKYRTIAYPNGDVPNFYGVCTDVIIRAYRVLGIDLQALVHVSKLGSGDTNIDHRRVGTLQKYFATYGESIPISEFSEDYWPGDVVSYYRPQNAHSRSHIAIVSDVVGPSGNFMIIHNRGWGPQQEDGLFVDKMTGHYRYSALRRPFIAPKAPAVAKTKPPVATGAAQRPVKTSPTGAPASPVGARASLAPAKPEGSPAVAR